jgi:hypothetical protein
MTEAPTAEEHWRARGGVLPTIELLCAVGRPLRRGLPMIALLKFEQRSFKKVVSKVPSKRQNVFGRSTEDLTYESPKVS